MTDRDNGSQERASPIGGDYLTELIRSVSGDAQKPAATEETTPAAVAPSPSSTFPAADLISSLMSNPELLSKLPTILSTVKPLLEMLGSASKPQAQDSIPTAAKPQIDAHSAKSRDRRAELLCAMKPYLSHDRCEAIDYIIKLSRLGEILKTL